MNQSDAQPDRAKSSRDRATAQPDRAQPDRATAQPDRDASIMRDIDATIAALSVLGRDTQEAQRDRVKYWRDGIVPPNLIDELRKEPAVRAYELLTSILGVGPVTARKWIDAGVTTLAAAATQPLTHMQKLGIKHHADLILRIPRAEATRIIGDIDQVARRINIVIEAAGSYRRGAASSGDIDLLAADADLSALARSLSKCAGYVDTVVSGPERLTFLWRDDSAPVRQVDVLSVPHASYALALNYFTGGFVHNTWLRGVAKSKGYRLNQRALMHGTARVEVETERDLYAILGCAWIEPASRR